MNIKQVIKYWEESSERDFEVAKTLLKAKHYDFCLFICHLAIEKLIKGLVFIKTKKTPPFIHNLDTLIMKTGLDFSEQQMRDLKIITTFNIRARYDDFKHSFYKKCTKQYAEKSFDISKNTYLWLKKQYPKK